MAAPRYRPRVVFAPDDTFGARTEATEPTRLLIVEDDYLIATQMETALAGAGFEIVGIATTADEAIELAASEAPTLMVMDVRLSGSRDGIDAAIEIFRSHGIRCVFATAHHDERARARGREAVPLAWLPKPYTMTALIATVRSAVRDLEDRTV
jgi:two-component system, response regulator PdtaR